MTTLSISIVLYYPNFSMLDQALHSLSEVVDFAEDNSIICYLINNTVTQNYSAEFGQIKQNYPKLNIVIIQNTFNSGYGAANNQAIKISQAKFHLVMNPDVFVEKDAIWNAITIMEESPEIGLICPAVFGTDGQRHYVHKTHPTLLDMFLRSAAPSFIKKFFQKRLLRHENRYQNWDEPFAVNYPSGCFMFFKTAPLQEINGFDPKFFLYYEDADIGRRIEKIAKVMYQPSVKIIHQWQRGTHNNRKLRYITIKSGLYYIRKWGGFL